MDLSVYITELLNEHGTVSIPQIGVFKQVRMRGYYNAEEGKLYPPYFQTGFEYKPDTDNTLLQYIIGKANVSEQSARYFMDRYLQNILQQAEIGEALLGRLGWIAKEGNVLTFRAAPNVSSASAAFGFSPVDIKAETEQTPIAPEISIAAEPITPIVKPEPQTIVPVQQEADPEKPVVTKTEVEEVVQPTGAAPEPKFHIEKELGSQQIVDAPAEVKPAAQLSPLLRQHVKSDSQQTPPVTPQPTTAAPVQQQPAHVQPVAEKEYIKPFYTKTWFFALVAGAAVIAGIIFFYPRNGGISTATEPDKGAATPSMDSVVVKTPVVPDTVQVKVAGPVVDTAAANRPLPASTEFAPEVETPSKATAATGKEISNTNNYQFVLIGGSYGLQEQAQAAAERYHAAGINASAFKNTGKTIKVALGFYKTYAEGQQAKKELVKQQKVLPWKLYVETIRKKLKK